MTDFQLKEKAKLEEQKKKDELEALLAKVAEGKKLTNKEMRSYEKYKEEQGEGKDEGPEDEFEANDGLNAFSFNIPDGGSKVSVDGFAVEGFTMTAPKQPLLVEANLKITSGHRYGLLGPNGQGKTTLLKHIANGEIPVHESWDYLLVEQEAKATDDSVLQAVLSANTKMVSLMNEE